MGGYPDGPDPPRVLLLSFKLGDRVRPKMPWTNRNGIQVQWVSEAAFWRGEVTGLGESRPGESFVTWNKVSRVNGTGNSGWHWNVSIELYQTGLDIMLELV